MLKFSRVEALRPSAEATVDEHFAALAVAEIGPLGPLHFLKRVQAAAGAGALLDGDAEDIKVRAAEQDERLAYIDRRRRDLKAKIRAAATSAEIKELVADLKESPCSSSNPVVTPDGIDHRRP